MKKNLFSIIIIALLLVDIAFTGFLAFSVIPAAKQANELISKVCGAIDLELEYAGGDAGSVKIGDLEEFDIADDMTINLKKSADGKDHVAVVGVTLSINKTHKDYATVGASVKEKTNLIKDVIRSTISKFTIEDMTGNPDMVKEELRQNIRTLIGSDLIYSVAFRNAIYQ